MISSNPSPESWKKNLYAIFVAELLVMVGFSFVFPFLPLYIGKLGNYSSQQAAFWAGIGEGVAGLAMFLTSPLWGIWADRSGKKPMVLRAMFASVITVTLLAFAKNVAMVIVLRLIQGALSGTLAAASALVASMTPKDKRPFAMGLLMTAVYVGNSVGPLLGGIAADKFGYVVPFFIAAGLLLSGGLTVLFLVKEKFEAPYAKERASLGGVWKLAFSPEIFPLLVIQFCLYAGPNMVAPIIPLLMQQLNPLGAAATSAGIAIAIAGGLAGISATMVGRLGERIPLKTVLILSCLGTCLIYLPPLWVTTVPQLTVFIALRGLINGGIVTVAYTLLSFAVPEDRQGVVFGIGQSANSLGSGVGPIIGGALGSSFGLKPVFAFTSGIYLLSAVLIIKTLPKQKRLR